MPGLNESFNVLDPALNLNKNYFLEASAGSGKTFTIENFVVRLIENHIPIRDILIVTFTRAATLELKSRIRKNLAEKKLRRAFVEFDEANIFTIHSFCFHALQEHALETQFPISFDGEASCSEKIKYIFKDFFRSELSENDIHPKQLNKVLKEARYDIHRLIKQLISPRPNIGRQFKEIAQDMREEVERLALRRDVLCEELLGYASCFSGMCTRQKKVKPEIEQALRNTALLFQGNIEHIIDSPLLKMVPENLLKRETYPELLHRLNERLIPLVHEASNSEAILSRISHSAHLFLKHVCEKEDLAFYDDLLSQMHHNLSNQPFVKKIRGRYRAVLIDEFQDTDPIQWDIFSTLFLGFCPLFLVGDPKQSIYRFRGADLYTYMRAKTALGEEAQATLTYNYRSSLPLLEGLNTLFGQTKALITLPKTGENLPIRPLEPAAKNGNQGGVIFCCGTSESELFVYIIQAIEELSLQGIPYRECAVLVKDHEQAKRFCSFCPLPYVTKKGESLLHSSALSILEDLLLALYYPKNRNYLFKVLGGPFFSLQLDTLHLEIDRWIEPFLRYHDMLIKEGILPLFYAIVKEGALLESKLYIDLLHLVEYLAENTKSPRDYCATLQKMKQLDPDAESIKARAKGSIDAIQVMTIHVSKGLEFTAIFPLGLVSTCELDEPEELSEKMRQLYVALTRAKQWLYLLVLPKAETPMAYFLAQVLSVDQIGDFENTREQILHFIEHKPCFTLATLKTHKRANFKQGELHEFPFFLLEQESLPPFENCAIHSFSSLAVKTHSFSKPIFQVDNELPSGSATGQLLHRILERLDFKKSDRSALDEFLKYELVKTPLETKTDLVAEMLHNLLRTTLKSPQAAFALSDLDPKKMIHEMEFLYSKHPDYIKGFIDLFFEYQGWYYIIDWKSNLLENYTPLKMEEAFLLFNYNLQAQFYTEAALKYLALFGKEDQFAGCFYIFLRGLGAEGGEGVYWVPRL